MINIISITERKSIRKSTAVKSAATAQRLKERNAVGKRRKIRHYDNWKPTQEELLEEAKITEAENLKSLGISSYFLFCLFDSFKDFNLKGPDYFYFLFILHGYCTLYLHMPY